MIELINANAGLINLIFSSIVAVSTLIYAVLTWQLVSETKNMRECQTEPKIVISISPRADWINFIDIKVQNIGLGPAYNISFELDTNESLNASKDVIENLFGLYFFKSGLNFLGPRDIVSTFFTSMIADFEAKANTKIEIWANYKSSTNTIYRDKIILDFNEFKGLTQMGKPPLNEIAYTLKQLHKDVQWHLKGSKRFKVDIYSSVDRDKENDNYRQ